MKEKIKTFLLHKLIVGLFCFLVKYLTISGPENNYLVKRLTTSRHIKLFKGAQVKRVRSNTGGSFNSIVGTLKEATVQ